MAAEYIKAVQTANGPLPIDFNSLANKPNMNEYSKVGHKHTALDIGIDSSDLSFKAFIVSDTSPSNHNVFWIDTNGGLKYWSESANDGEGAWIPVPIAFV